VHWSKLAIFIVIVKARQQTPFASIESNEEREVKQGLPCRHEEIISGIFLHVQPDF